MKWATATILRRFGFRNILVINSIISSAFLAVCAAFSVTTPIWVMMILLLIGGFFRSLQFTSIDTIAYAEIEPGRVSRATSLVSVAQQLADRKSTRLNSSHMSISYAVFCLKKKNNILE